nr:hypothetical protein [Trentepohlia sp. YN1317]
MGRDSEPWDKACILVFQDFTLSANIFHWHLRANASEIRRGFLQGSPIELQAIQSENRRFFPQSGKKGEKNHGSRVKLGSRIFFQKTKRVVLPSLAGEGTEIAAKGLRLKRPSLGLPLIYTSENVISFHLRKRGSFLKSRIG